MVKRYYLAEDWLDVFVWLFNMLPNNKRLNLSQDYKWVASGKRIETLSFKLFLKLGRNTLPKIGVALSKQSFPKANLRNKAKRITLLTVEPLYERLPNNLNLVIMPKSVCLEKSSETLREELLNVKDFNFTN